MEWNEERMVEEIILDDFGIEISYGDESSYTGGTTSEKSSVSIEDFSGKDTSGKEQNVGEKKPSGKEQNVEHKSSSGKKEKSQKKSTSRKEEKSQKESSSRKEEESQKESTSNSVPMAEFSESRRFSIQFSLSRETEEYLQRYYNAKEEDICFEIHSLYPVNEMISIEHQDASYLLKKTDYNTNLTWLPEGSLPEKMLGSYNIPAKLFTEEGEYQIHIRSWIPSSKENTESAIGEYNIRHDKMHFITKNLTFAIDKTPPAITIGRWREQKSESVPKAFTITALDNIRLKKVKVYIRHGEDDAGSSMEYTEKDFNENHSLLLKNVDYEDYEIIGYEAWDYAGNYIRKGDLPENRVMVVSPRNIVRRYYARSVWNGLSSFLMTLLIFVLFFAILKKIRKRLYSWRQMKDGFSDRPAD